MPYQTLTLKDVANKTNALFEKYPVKKDAIFGSFSRNEMKRGSDIDFLIELEDLSEPLLFVEIARELENLLKRKIDLISISSLEYSDEKSKILSEAKVIYEKRH